MKVFNLGCAEGHRFEGWFASEDDYVRQAERGLTTCPMCASADVHRLPSAPHVHGPKSAVSRSSAAQRRQQPSPSEGEAAERSAEHDGERSAARTGAESAERALTTTPPVDHAVDRTGHGAHAANTAQAAQAVHDAHLRALRRVLADTADVGERFPEEARRIHYGEAPERAIRGHATADETRALLDEGIAVLPLVLPAALKGTVQ